MPASALGIVARAADPLLERKTYRGPEAPDKSFSTMMIFTFVAMTLGLVYILTQSAIAALLRMWLADRHVLLEGLIYCPACTGFWVGFVLKLLGYWNGSAMEAGIISCALGALWGVYGPDNVWPLERDHDNTQEEENGQGTDSTT